MASMEPIDITSSDSDSDLREIDNYRDESPEREAVSSVNAAVTRRLPPGWGVHYSNPGKLTLLRTSTLCWNS